MSSDFDTDMQNKQLRTISNFRNKNEKLSWTRKRTKLESIIEKELQPLEMKILQLTELKYKIFDDITQIRTEMVKECIHPFDELVHKGTYVLCKFCGNKISLPRSE